MSVPPDLLRYASDYPADTVLRDYVDVESGLRMLIVRGPFSFCAYVGVKADHTLAGLEELRFSCHHSITFSDWGSEGTWREKEFYWWGWDYAHFTDYIDWEMSLPEDASPELRRFCAEINKGKVKYSGRALKNWTLGEVVEDTLDVMMELKHSLLASERYAGLVIAH